MSDQQAGLAQPAPPAGQALNVTGQPVRIQQVLSAAGPQFVLASGQVVPTGAANMTRLSMVTGRGGTVQLTPTKVGTSGSAMSTALMSISQPSVNASSYPTLVNSLSSPSRRPSNSPTSSGSPQRKRPRLMNESVSEDVLARRRLIEEHKKARMKSARSKYAHLAAELFFLQVGGNMADFVTWRKKPSTAQFLHFLRSHRLDPDDDDEDLTQCLSPLKTASTTTGTAPSSPAPSGTTPIPALQSHSSSVPDPSEVSGATTAATTPSATTSATSRASSAQDGHSPDRRTGSPTKLRGHTPRPKQLQNHEASPTSQEHIVEKAKQEAYVMQRIVELQREGLWTEKRLPKVQEPPRGKAHWDYLLEEMVWLAADFAQERKWKKAAAKKCARMVQKHFHEKQMNAQKAEKNQELRLKKIASAIAKEVKNFWTNIEKLVEFKQQTKLEEKRKQALDQQLSYIVDQTEKYSMLLTEGMNRPGGESGNNSATASVPPSVVSYSSGTENEAQSDDDFRPDMDSEDDERTIAKDEDIGGNAEEILALQQQSEMSLEDILKDLPGYLDSRDSLLKDESSSRTSTVVDEESEEDEEEEEEEEEEDDEDEEMEVEDNAKEEPEPKTEPGLNDLYRKSSLSEEDTDKEINNVAAMAESIQPKGNTLSSTNVVTKIPFLLKHSLREYQHIGLDWLVTMYDRNLNGILADEMGLGKTIQTISLLAHLACEKEDWGPHLIIVPTSVMLNWEMELKKWCPGFKILTYYGSQKERRMKRTGWTKPNAFHVCITSYKLVIQDHQSFRRKKWKYLILDEAQNIKNFKSQRWQLLLNFQTQRRLLLTGTPLQNNLMELWSLMHFLMPHVFQSHREFKEWFSNPVTGMIEGNSEYNESIIKRLHKVLRPFLLRRLKCEVEKQLPKKYEHIVMCRLSKRQRYLYDDFMSRTKTQETLATGNLLSVINVLMQLRKVCNHPNLFEVRPTTSPFQMEGLTLHTASLVYGATDYDVWTHVNLSFLNLNLIDLESMVSAFVAHRVKRYRTPARLIEEIDSLPDPPPSCPKGRLSVNVRVNPSPTPLILNQQRGITTLGARVGTSPAPLRKTSKNVGNSLQRVSVIAKSSSPSSAITSRVNSRPVLRVPPMNIADSQGSNGTVQSRSPAKPDESQSEFFLPQLYQRRKRLRKEKLRRLARCNARRCEVCPIYGEDLVDAFCALKKPSSSWSDGIVNCYLALHYDERYYWRCTDTLISMLHTPQDYVDELQDLFSRFVLWVPAVSAPAPRLHASHPPPSKFWGDERIKAELQHELGSRCSILHPVASAMVTQFPDPRLIQYDCGKLQTMDRLLRQLKAGHHRVLIFTQMTRMLDVLEAFLNFHGHIYLRLDGTTRVDQRQMVMERFNSDARIFCMILSTRSGGVGVNLTGADTVIFYDSDWNPTMDAQAQDRCHRIGQTRDVNIYRLISEKTVEENILKKANQKRLLGNLAIEGGNFTTAFFKSSTIQDLFDVDVSENDASRRMAEVVDKEQAPAGADDKVALGALESALAAAEDESDVIALKSAKAEAVADLEEFDESVPLSEEGVEGEQPEMSKAEQEVQNLVQQLTGVERYAMTFLEETDSWSAKQLAEAEAEIERQKRDWEMNRLANAREDEQRRRSLMDDPEPLLTYSREDASNQEWMSDVGKELMPMWCPLTPPQCDNDVYIDSSLGLLYESTIMSESELPPVYVKKELKRRHAPEMMANCEREGRRPLKIRLRDEPSSQAPRSLFDRPTPALIKMRRDMKLQKCRGILRGPAAPLGTAKPTTAVKPLTEQDHTLEWLVYEDHTLLKEVQNTQEITLNLVVVIPAHIPNWDYLSETVTSVGRTYRSPKQCRNRYESVIIPREEGKLTYSDQMQKKQKKLKSLYSKAPQTKSNRPLRTAQLYAQDNNQSFSSLYLSHFELVRNVSNKRSPTVKPLLVNPAAKNPKHAAVLAEAGIDYDRPLEPQDVALRRADRIAREKQKNQAAAAKASGAAAAAAAAAAGASGPAPPMAPIPGTSTVATLPVATVQPTPQQLQPAASTTPPVNAMVSVGTPQLRAHRPVTALMMQEVVRTVGGTPTVVSLASLTPAQLQAATQVATPRLTSAQPSVSGAQVSPKAVATGMVTTAGKTLNSSQLQFYRQQALKKHLKAQAAAGTSPSVSTTTANVAPTQTVQVVQAVQPVQSIAVASTASPSTAISTVQKVTASSVASVAASTVAAVVAGTASTSTATGLPVGVSTVAGVTTVQVTPGQQQQRAQMQYMKHTIATKQGVPRPLTESEMAILVKRQQAAAAATAAASGTSSPATTTTSTIAAKTTQLTTAQLLAQAGLTVQTGASGSSQTPVALVKTVASAGGVTLPVSGMTLPQLKATLAPGLAPGVKAASQQIRQLTLQQLPQRKLPPGQKVTQMAQVKGASTQVLFQSQKAMTVQQIQQVMKHVQPGQAMQTVVSSGTAAGQVISHVLTKAPHVAAAGRVVPAAQRQTVQMVAASQAGVTRASVPNVVDASGRVQTTMTTTLASALASPTGTIKVSSPVTSAMLSQAVAALQNPTSMVVRPSPVRIHTSTPLMAVTVQQPVGTQASTSNVAVTSQQQFQQIQLQLQQQQQQSQNQPPSSDNAQ